MWSVHQGPSKQPPELGEPPRRDNSSTPLLCSVGDQSSFRKANWSMFSTSKSQSLAFAHIQCPALTILVPPTIALDWVYTSMCDGKATGAMLRECLSPSETFRLEAGHPRRRQPCRSAEIRRRMRRSEPKTLHIIRFRNPFTLAASLSSFSAHFS